MPVVNLPPEGLCRARPSFGILSSYPPTACGLATFTAALASGMAVHDAQVGIVRVVDTPGQCPGDDRVVGELVNGSPLAPSSPLGDVEPLRRGSGSA